MYTIKNEAFDSPAAVPASQTLMEKRRDYLINTNERENSNAQRRRKRKISPCVKQLRVCLPTGIAADRCVCVCV